MSKYLARNMASQGGNPEKKFLCDTKPATAAQVQAWAEAWAAEHIDMQVITGDVQSVQAIEAKKNRPGHLSASVDSPTVIIKCKGYTWRMWSGLLTQTSSFMQEKIEDYPPGSFKTVEIDFDWLNISPYVIEQVIKFWCTLEFNLAYDEPRVLEIAELDPLEAPGHRDFTNIITHMETLVDIYWTAGTLHDLALQEVALAALRSRLVPNQFHCLELIGAMKRAFTDEKSWVGQGDCKNSLHKVFLSAIIPTDHAIVFDDAIWHVFQEMMLHPDAPKSTGVMMGLHWYYRQYLPSKKSRSGTDSSQGLHEKNA